MAFVGGADKRWMWAATGFAVGLGTGLLLSKGLSSPAAGSAGDAPPVLPVKSQPEHSAAEVVAEAAAAPSEDEDKADVRVAAPTAVPAAAAVASPSEADAEVAGANAAPAAVGATADGAAVDVRPPPPPSPRTVRITALTLFPIKSCAGVSVPTATVSSRGFEHDRQFLVVDFTGRFLTQRKLPRMALITPSIRVEAPSPAAAGGDVLVLAAPGVEPLDVPVIPEAGGGKGRPPPAQVVVWGDTVDAVDQGDAPAAWLAKFLEQPGVRLVRMANNARRPVEDGHTDGPPGTFEVSFADGYPWLLASETSLANLNKEMAAEAAAATAAAGRDAPRVRPPVFDMRRFRPNVVVAAADGGDALPPWAEDAWTRLSVAPAGDDAPVRFQVAKPCDRCKVPTVLPDEGAFEGRAAVDVYNRTMGRLRAVGRDVMFGINLVCDSPVGATVSVGDVVTVTTAAANGGA